MHKVQIFPIGNVNTCLIKFEKGKSILIDFAHLKQENNPDDKRCDIVAEEDILIKRKAQRAG